MSHSHGLGTHSMLPMLSAAAMPCLCLAGDEGIKHKAAVRPSDVSGSRPAQTRSTRVHPLATFPHCSVSSGILAVRQFIRPAQKHLMSPSRYTSSQACRMPGLCTHQQNHSHTKNPVLQDKEVFNQNQKVLHIFATPCSRGARSHPWAVGCARAGVAIDPSLHKPPIPMSPRCRTESVGP
jgi:hypothetical protein